MYYFSATTLTTVGFGDFYPHSDLERLFVVFIFLIGIGTFSSFIGTFWEMLGKYNDLNSYYEDYDNLSRFFGVLEKFNWRGPLDVEFKEKVEKFFEYRWDNYKHYLFEDSFSNIHE